MTTGALSTRVDDWLYDTLTADADVIATVADRVYADDTAPATYGGAMIRYAMLAGPQTLGVGTARILGRYVYLIEAVAETANWDDVEAAADAIYSALHGQRGTVTGAEVLSCVCEEETRRGDIEEGGTRVRYLGWRVRIEATPA